MRTGCASCISQIFCYAKIGKKKPTLCVTKGQGQRQIRRRRTSHKRRYKNKNQRDGMRGAYAKRFSGDAPPVVALFSCFLVGLRGLRRVLVSAPEARSAEGDGRRQPPVSVAADLFKTSTRLIAICLFSGVFHAFRAYILHRFSHEKRQHCCCL